MKKSTKKSPTKKSPTKKSPTKKSPTKKSPTKKSPGSRGSERRSERSAKGVMPRRQDHYFMAALPEVMVEAFRSDLCKALEGKLGDVILVDVTKDWSPDTSAEVIATLSADLHPYTDMDAVMTDAAELVRKTAVKVFEGVVMPAVPSPTAPAPEPKTYPVVLDRKQLRKEPGCIFVDVREITFRSEFQIELYLSTNSAKKKWKDEDEDEGEE